MKAFIGIDPPKGIAVWLPEQKRFQIIATVNFWGIIDWLREEEEILGLKFATVIIEDPRINKPTFVRPGRGGKLAMQKISQNVGQNKEDAKLLIDYFIRNNIQYKAVPPIKGILKKWKRDKAMFEKMTGWNLPTSEHGRDAAALVWGR